MRYLTLFALMLFTAVWSTPQSWAGSEVAQSGAGQREKLVIHTTSGQFPIYAEIARSHAEQQKGLMYRREMAAEHGMLFVYPRDQIMHFWMKNTHISLDLIFIDKSGRIVGFFENAVPGSLANMSSARPARAVLEINAGLVQALGMKSGDQIAYAKLGWVK
jgi:uncharacterized membrane protein (UPF0127 family)